MSRLLSLAFLSVIFVYGLSIGFALQPALADSCDNAAFSACLSECRSALREGPLGNTFPGAAPSPCLQGCTFNIEERKKKGQCKQAKPVSWR
jgi:hypothetical protein